MERLTLVPNDGRDAGLRGYYSEQDAINRLAAYEDTGLTPTQIKYILPKQSVEEAVERMKAEKERYDEWFAWKQAEAEGRLVMLPCKVGGDLWVNDRDGKPRRMVLDAPDIRCHCAKEDNLCIVLCDSPKDGICAYRLKNDGTDIGKTVFRTREEAEAALKEREAT